MSHIRSPYLSFALAALALLCPGAAGAHDGSHERIDRLTAAIAEAPSSAGLYAERAAVYRDDEEFNAALDDYERAIRLDPVALGVSIQYAETLFEAGRVPQSLEAVEGFILDHPDDLAARLLYARILAKMGSHEEAARNFQRVVADAVAANRKPSPDLVLQWANALSNSGDAEAAIAALDRGCELLGRLMVFEERSIALETDLGRFESALQRIDRIMASTPRKERLLVLRGETLEAAGRIAESSAAYREALESLSALPTRLREVPASRKLATVLRSRLEPRSE